MADRPTRPPWLRPSADTSAWCRCAPGNGCGSGRISLWIRWPTPAAAHRPGDPNDSCGVVQAQVGALRALIPADAEGNVLTTLPRLAADVLVVSHHGSTDAALPKVLAHLRPGSP